MRQAIEAGNIDRRTVSIEFLRSDHTTMRRYVLLNAYPSKWELPAMDASGSQAAVEKITISSENILQLE